MSKINWSEIDDYLFVHLVSSLLMNTGFVDIDFQGDGPDGGIDLFASELIPFSIQGIRRLRWAIQCKFSSDTTRRSVSDRDVRDIEGILRSDRYQAQNIEGYLLITNRRITQNVIERLRGIDRQSQYQRLLEY